VWQVVVGCGKRGGGLRIVVKEGVKDRVGEDGVFGSGSGGVRGFFVCMVSF
jgi:hypothetical protein